MAEHAYVTRQKYKDHWLEKRQCSICQLAAQRAKRAPGMAEVAARKAEKLLMNEVEQEQDRRKIRKRLEVINAWLNMPLRMRPSFVQKENSTQRTKTA